jgi:uncharacterized Zn-binding protein involved in type VI secretion
VAPPPSIPPITGNDAQEFAVNPILTFFGKAMCKVIRLNDSISHGGTVTSIAATHFTVEGIRVAYEEHKTSCGATLQSTVANFGHYSSLFVD